MTTVAQAQIIQLQLCTVASVQVKGDCDPATWHGLLWTLALIDTVDQTMEAGQ